LEQVSGTARATRADRYAVQLIDTATLEARTVGVLPRDARRIDSATWDATKQRLIIRSADSSRKELPTLVLQRNGTRWRILPRATADGAKVANARVQLELQQDLNQSPVLIARDAKSGARRTLLELNPWLGQHTLSRVEEISWVSKDGRTWKGGLYYPLGYLPDRRYPLMLQTHGFQPGKFALSGITANFNAQALAARGIAVLQVDDDGIGVTGEGEWPAAQAIYEGAIDALDARGLIDRQRVGLQGWSRTGGYVGYTLTHSSYPFAAAALTDSADFGWWYYLSVGGTHGESAYGVKPYGAGFDVWRRMSATFNLDRVRTPMFMWQAGSPVNLWDWYAVLKRLGKPVEYWYLPDGAHVPYKVGERVHMSELLVDWFDFWLNDHEVATPEKAEQYARWRKWREQEG
jgi:dipeptidyl aminopeptidase/acylaminoacyl peptidase